MGQEQDKPREWWTVSELARAARVSVGYIRQLLLRGKLRGEKFGPIWRISDREARRWLQERRES